LGGQYGQIRQTAYVHKGSTLLGEKMMKRILIAVGLTLSIVASLVAGCAYLVDRAMMQKPFPHEMKLCDITNDIVVAKVVWPNAEPWAYQLVIGLPTNKLTGTFSGRACPDFTGTVTITDPGSAIVDKFLVSATNAQQCNWLDYHHGLDAFILTWSQTNALRSCDAGTQYTLQLECDKRPSEFKSLWLSYLQSGNQKKEESPNQLLHRTQ
jgi:hypothetical protein